LDYLCIDLKCFYASVECVDRGLDPFKTCLVVADKSRGNGSICLAISPLMKQKGVKNRCRLFDIPKNINYIVAKPRMKKYIDVSAEIYSVYLKYVAKEDIHVYSIDEAFLDVTHYHKLYNKSTLEIGKMIISDIVKTTGITAACGAGPNMFLAKIALDIMAKKTKDNIAYLTEKDFKLHLWDHRKLTDFWQIGQGISKRLNKLGLYSLKDVAYADEKSLYKEFGVNAEFLIDHANGKDPTTIKTIKDYVPKQKSLSSGQVLEKDYNFKDGKLVIKEMVDGLVLDLVRKRLVTDHISFSVGYSNDYNVNPVGMSKKLDVITNSYEILSKEISEMYELRVDRNVPIRRMMISFGNLQDESFEQYDLFTDIDKINKEKKLQDAIIELKDKYGKSSVLRGSNLEENATTLKRNKLIGGHNGE